jgi:hypothetical protein
MKHKLSLALVLLVLLPATAISQAPEAEREAKVAVGEEAPRQVSGRERPDDPHATLIAFPEYEIQNGYSTRIELINGLIHSLDISVVPRYGDLGYAGGQVELDLWGRGFSREFIRDILTNPDSTNKADVRVLSEAGAIDELFGKFTGALHIIGPNTSTESSYSFNSARPPMHLLSFPYRPQDATLTEVVVSNEADSSIDVYLRAPTGQEFLVEPNLGLRRQKKFDFSGFNHITNGEIVAYQAGTHTPIDALVGTMKVRYLDDYGRALGYAMRGVAVDGTHEFSSEFFVPVYSIEQMDGVPVTDGWEHIVYWNKTDEPQQLEVLHYAADGQLVDIDGLAILTIQIPANGLLSETADDLGVERQNGGVLAFNVKAADGEPDPSSYGDMVFLLGDVSDGVTGASALAGDLAPSSRDMSKFLRFPLAHRDDLWQLIIIHNPNDEETMLDFGAFSRLGNAVSHYLPDFLPIPPHSTVVLNSPDVLAVGGNCCSSILGADNALVGMVLDYRTAPVKSQLSTSAIVVEAVNEPKAEYEFDRINVQGQIDPETAFAFTDRITGLIVNYRTIVATQKVDRIEMLVDGVVVGEHDGNDMFHGQVGFDYRFTEARAYQVDFVGYAADQPVRLTV